jgi:hypothetical protein
MTLSDADVADLARQAVDQRDLALEIRIVPADPVDPYRWGTPAWTVYAGSRRFLSQSPERRHRSLAMAAQTS